MAPFDVILVAATIRLAAPLLFAAIGELLAERSGVINIGLEGFVLIGAFAGFVGVAATGSLWIGTVLALAAGIALAAVMALHAVQLRADQIVVGVGINVLALGLTTYAYRELFVSSSQVTVERMRPLAVPVLGDLPVAGDAFFHQIPLVYVAYLLVPITWFVLYHTTWGLNIRAAGEVPAAVDTAGTSVARVRWITTLLAGGLAGLGGASLSIGQLGLFTEGMSAGRGFLALAAVVFGRWRPLGVLFACLVFGSADALQLRLQSESAIPRSVWIAIMLIGVISVLLRLPLRRSGVSAWISRSTIPAAAAIGGGILFLLAPRIVIPSQLWLTLPYVLTLLALAGFVGRARTPAALSIPYRRGGEAP
jgi:simple sugar transport system permease protein